MTDFLLDSIESQRHQVLGHVRLHCSLTATLNSERTNSTEAQELGSVPKVKATGNS
jgi:hypothetical protein